MLTFFKEKTSPFMGNGPNSGEKSPDEEEDDASFRRTLHLGGLHQTQNIDGLIFFAGTDKARVISEILEERGWCRTKDVNVTNFTIKWCLAHQVDWTQFQEGKQLINNIPGQLAFADKINLWYTTRDYLRDRRTLDGNHIQTFLPMTFVLDDENEVAEFLRSYKKHTRTWICKPRYSYAGRGIYVISVNSDLNTIFKFTISANNRLQYQPKLPGYLMQEYISRPLLIKGRKFDIRVHWLVAWTKPLLVFYNHNASVVRLSLNLYREFDFDRATHLTNLSVQENHHRYAFSQEATGMTMHQLNYYFNQCFRPFHPKMCQDWVMTVMQERMQTIIRHVIRASKPKLTRGAGQFGLFGCDFLLDENFRIWLLEVNDNPGVGWGNPRVNTTTKPLFEETLNIVLECFDKYKKKQPLLPIQCLKNYQLIYNEDDDAQRLSRDDNQIFTERLAIRYASKEHPSRASYHRLLPRVNTSRTSTNQNDNKSHRNNDILFPVATVRNFHSSLVDITPSTSSVIDVTPSNPAILNTIPVNLSVADSTVLNSPILITLPLSPTIVNTTPLGSPIFNRASLIPDIVSTTPESLSIIDTIPLISVVVNTTDDVIETIEPFKHEDDIELERLMKPRTSRKNSKPPLLSSLTIMSRPLIKVQKSSFKRTLSTTNTFNIQRKQHIDLTSIVIDSKRYIHRNTIKPLSTESIRKQQQKISKNKTILKDEDNQSVATAPVNMTRPELCSFN